MLNASAGLITALKASLANSGHGWTVASVSETSDTRLSAVSVSGSVSTAQVPSDGVNPPTVNVTGSTSSSNASITTVKTTIDLVATGLPIASSSAAQMKMTYQSVAVDGSFSYGVIVWTGKQYKTTDAALNTTITGLASTWQSAGDTALKDLLNAGAASNTHGVVSIPSGLLNAVKASLAGTAAGWEVRGRHAAALADGSTQVTVIVHSATGIVQLTDTNGDTHLVPTTISYLYTVDAAGSLTDATLMMQGAGWRTTDSTLFATLKTMGETWLTAQGTTLQSEVTSVG